MAGDQTFGQRWDEYRPSKAIWFWSCVVCLIAPIVIGFTWGGWVTAGSASRMQTQAGEEARAELAATYCVSKFERASDEAAQLAALKKTESWQRDDFLDKGGWTRLPGLQKPVNGAAELCAQQLLTTTLGPNKPTTSSGWTTTPG